MEQRFKQTEEDYSLVEFQASGFHQKRMIDYLQRKNVNSKAFMFGLVPVSILEKISFSPALLYSVLMVEELLQKMPILRNQLGDILLVGWKQNAE